MIKDLDKLDGLFKKIISQKEKLSGDKIDTTVEQELYNDLQDFLTNYFEKESENQQLSKIVSEINDAIFKISIPDASFEYVNNAVYFITGYSVEEFYNTKNLLLKIIHPDWHEQFKVRWKGVIQGEIMSESEYSIITKAGEQKWVSLHGIVVKDSEHAPVAVEGVITDITDKKNQEIVFKTNETKYSELFNNIKNCVAVYKAVNNGQDFEFVDFNKSAEKIEKVKKKELLGKRVTQLFPGIRNFGLLDVFQMVWKTGESSQFPPGFYQDSKRSGWRENFVYKLPSGEIVAVYDDITERVLNEQKLKESEQKFKSIFDTVASLILSFNAEGIIIECNQQVDTLLGYTPEEVKGREFLQLVHPDYVQVAVSNFNEIVEKGFLYHKECTFQHKKGKKIIAILNAVGLKNEKGEFEKSICSLNDITDRKLAEYEIRLESDINSILAKISSEALKPDISLQNIARIVHVASLELTQSEYGFISFADPQEEMEKLLVKTQNSKIQTPSSPNHSVEEGIPLSSTCFGDEIVLVDSAKKIDECTDGRLCLNNLICLPSRANDSIVGHICVGSMNTSYSQKHLKIIHQLNDVYSFTLLRRIYEMELIRAKEKAVESDKLKSSFLANMSHELRTPMNGILGFSGILYRDGISREKKERCLGMIESSTNRLLNVLDDIILYSKLESRQIEYNQSEVHLNELLTELLVESELKIKNKPQLKLDLKNELKQSSIIKSDRDKLQRVFSHLLNNAIKFTDKGSIEFGCLFKKESNRLLFYVKDTGVGIAKEKLAVIFERFRQEDDSNTRAFDGTGLGLAITKELVTILGGELKVESQKNKGALFCFDIPFVTKSRKLAHDLEYSNAYTWPGKNILIVEDEEVSFVLLKEILGPSQAILHYARTGKRAVEMVKENDSIDLVLMDVKLPEMGGYEATRIIKQIDPTILVLAQTAYGFPGEAKKAKNAGCDDYIAKPYSAKALLQKMKRLLND